MILIDPDLEPDRKPRIRLGISSPASRKTERDERLPSVRTLNAFLREAQAAVRLKGLVSVLLTSDAAIQTLNRDFRRKNKPTDVLSFPAGEISRGEVAGDLAISVETALRQGREQGHSLGTEIKVLILHGLLHLAGFDHETDNGEMARKERALRAKLALPLGLIERVEGGKAGKKRVLRSAQDDKFKKRVLRSAQDDKFKKRVLRSAQDDKFKKQVLRSAQDDKVKGRAAAKKGRKP